LSVHYADTESQCSVDRPTIYDAIDATIHHAESSTFLGSDCNAFHSAISQTFQFTDLAAHTHPFLAARNAANEFSNSMSINATICSAIHSTIQSADISTQRSANNSTIHLSFHAAKFTANKQTLCSTIYTTLSSTIITTNLTAYR